MVKTVLGSQMKQNVFENKRQAECWEHFHQVASIQDGSPKVMCKICGQIPNHPANGHRGTSSMNKHFLQGVNCQRVVPHSQDIRRFKQEGVCWYVHSYYFILSLLSSIYLRHAWPLRNLLYPTGLDGETHYIHYCLTTAISTRWASAVSCPHWDGLACALLIWNLICIYNPTSPLRDGWSKTAEFSSQASYRH